MLLLLFVESGLLEDLALVFLLLGSLNVLKPLVIYAHTALSISWSGFQIRGLVSPEDRIALLWRPSLAGSSILAACVLLHVRVSHRTQTLLSPGTVVSVPALPY